MRLSLLPTTLLMALLLETASAFSAIAQSPSVQSSVFTALPLAAVRDAASERQQDSRWWKSLVSSSADAETQDDSSNVQDYLRFLERRYTRLYEDEPQVKPFNVLEWLKQGETEHTQLQQNHDAFYALGVAGLAGKEMLQQATPSEGKYDLARRTLKANSSSAFYSQDLQASKQEPLSRAPSSAEAAAVSVVMSKKVLPALNRILVQRRVFLQMQTQRLHALLGSLLKTVMTAPKTLVRQAWNLGGGKQNVLATLSVVATLTLLALHLVVRESLGA